MSLTLEIFLHTFDFVQTRAVKNSQKVAERLEQSNEVLQASN